MDNIKRRVLAMGIAIVLLLLSGCQPTRQAEDTASTDATVSNLNAGEGIDESVEYAYSNRVFDLSATKGRFAVYYFRSNFTRQNPVGTSFSGDSALLVAPDGQTMLIDFNMDPVTSIYGTIQNNVTTKSAGAIFAFAGAEITVTGTDDRAAFKDNKATGAYGGAIYLNNSGTKGSSATIQGYTFENNTATTDPNSAIYLRGYSSITLTDVVFQGATVQKLYIAANGILNGETKSSYYTEEYPATTD